MKTILLTIVTIFVFTGCVVQPDNKIPDAKITARHNNYILQHNTSHTTLNSAIVSIASQLFTSNVNNEKTNIILTSFSDLNQLNKTTTFGRLLSESMFNELHIRKFSVTDFRGQNAISVNANGEFHITRDVEKLKDKIESTEYILVGTYVKFENDGVLINVRIIDSISGKIISTARVIYKSNDCSLFDLCPKKVKKIIKPISIITDNCSTIKCPEQKCDDGICSK